MISKSSTNIHRRAVAILRQSFIGALVFVQVWTPFSIRHVVYRDAGIYTGYLLAAGTAALPFMALRSTIANAADPVAPVDAKTIIEQNQTYSRGLVPDPSSLYSSDANGNAVLLPMSASPYSAGPGQLLQTPTPDFSAQTQNEGSNSAITSDAYDDVDNLTNETQGGVAPTFRGEAFRTVRGSQDRAHPDLRNDPILVQSGNVVANQEAYNATFAQCSTQTTQTATTTSGKIQDQRTCTKVNAARGSSTIIHDYDVLPALTVAGREGEERYDYDTQCDANGNNCTQTFKTRPLASQASLVSCGTGCIDVFLGQIGNDYWAGRCSVFSQEISLRLSVPQSVTSATLYRAKWDDYIQVSLNDQFIYRGPNFNFPPETAGECELRTSWDETFNVDITSQVRNSSDLNFKIRVSVTGKGEGYAVMRLIFDQKQLINDRGYSPPQAVELAQRYDDAQCTNKTVTPTQSPPLDANGCSEINGVTVCPSDFPPPPSASINPLWTEATIATDCNPSYGTYCWTDISGREQCYTQNETNSSGSNCGPLESDSSCGFVSSKCVQGATGTNTGACYVEEHLYDCGQTVTTPTFTQSDTTTCAGAIQCIGDSCLKQDQVRSTDDFAHATAAMSMVNSIATDSECRPDGHCYVFPGTAYECKNAVAGVQNCCTGPAAPSLTQYIAFLSAIGKLKEATAGLEIAQPIYGAWDKVASGVSQTFQGYWSSIKTSFTSVLDSISGATAEAVVKETATGSAEKVVASTFYDQTAQALINKTAELTGNIFGDAVRDALFEQAAGGAVGDYATTAAFDGALNAASYFMAAYMYYQIALMVIQVVWACEATELELNAKEQLKVCDYIGSYCKTEVLGVCVENRKAFCCYNSPLSRIIMQQAKGQLGQSNGNPDNPTCEGISIEQMDKVDFSRIDLSEWIAMLSIAGLMDSSPAGTAKDVSLDSMTGAGSTFDTSGYGENEDAPARQNSAERAISRNATADTNNTRSNTAQQFWYGDPQGSSDENREASPGFGPAPSPRPTNSGVPDENYDDPSNYPPSPYSQPDATPTPAPQPQPQPNPQPNPQPDPNEDDCFTANGKPCDQR